MMQSTEINPEFFSLLARSEELLAKAKIKRESEPFIWQESRQLDNEIDRILDEMTAMLLPTRLL